ncbi:AAA family ATPase [uncultured Pseudodesulfovibrio sp.]|uniref:AAA family ATPase n=1 Tax=uncultured Pseudodesulfovibrio sp. TaxID=2035858 RepID=UPI0029C81C3B|nr:AAA family ATPase [uncultured Pseudodesulfovibrio sp.]
MATPNPYHVAAKTKLESLFLDGYSFDDAIRIAQEWTKETDSEIDSDIFMNLAVEAEQKVLAERSMLQDSSRFRLVPLGELLTAPKPTEWLIRDYLEAQSLACLFGASGSMKTFVALDMALCCAAGLPWHGVNAPLPGPVVYVAGEGSRGLSKRIQAWLVGHGQVANTIPFFVASAGVEIRDPESLNEAMSAINFLASWHGSPRLIVLDTLARCFGPGDENSTSDMSGFVARLDELRSMFGCAVLVVHHTGLSEKERARGASSWRAALDMEYRLDKRDDLRILTCTKCKDFEPPQNIAFTYEQMETGWADEETGAPITSVVLHKTDSDVSKVAKQRPLTGAKKIALDTLCQCCNPGGWTHIDEWRDACYGAGITPSSSPDTKGRTFRRAVSDLRDLDLIHVKGDFYCPSGQADKSRACPALSSCPNPDGHGHTPLGVSGCPVKGEAA